MTGIFVDTTNLYRTVHKKFRRKLCYDRYRDHVNEVFGETDVNVAYVMQIATEAKGFIGCLRAAGFITKSKRPLTFRVGDREIKRCNWHVELLIDIFRNIEDLDRVIIGSSDSELLPLVNYLEELDIEVIIMATNVPKRLAEAASSVHEITEELLEDEDESV